MDIQNTGSIKRKKKINTIKRVKRIKNIENNIRKHPYMVALLICVGAEVFSLGQEEYFPDSSVMILGFLGMAVLFRYFLMGERQNTTAFLASSAGVMGACAGLCFVPFKGALLLTAGIVCISAVFLSMKERLFRKERADILIIALSMVTMVAYFIYTSSVLRQVDSYSVSSTAGHLGYAGFYYNNWFRLPDFDPRDLMQYYQPPLYYWLSAAVMRAATFVGVDYAAATECCQLVSMYGAMCTLIMTYRSFRLLGLKGKGLTAALAVVAFSNSLIMLSSGISNDMLSAAFEVGVIYGTIKWYRSRTVSDIMQIALCIGLGTMTKLSAAVTVPAVAVVFVYAFFRDIGSFRKYLLQYVLFILVCAPLAMWFPLRNYILFGVPLGYVPDGGGMDLSFVPVWQRLFGINAGMISTPITVDGADYNPLWTLFKSGAHLQRMFGSTPYLTFLYVLYPMNIILGMTGFAVMAVQTVKKRTELSCENVFVLLVYLSIMISFYVFCFRYPNIYAANIRYVFPVLIIGAYYVGSFSGGEYMSRVLTILQKGCILAVVCYSVTAVFMWLFAGFILM